MTPERAIQLVKFGRSTTKVESPAAISEAIRYLRDHPELWGEIDWTRRKS